MYQAAALAGITLLGNTFETGTTEAKQEWKESSYLEKLLFERGQQLTGNSVIGCRSGDELNLDKITVFVQEVKETSDRKEALVHEQVRRLREAIHKEKCRPVALYYHLRMDS